ncbi:MAG: right-handed parallel beta-helix repeat-containing protein, partial [Ilumatobacteraceae bacterium]
MSAGRKIIVIGAGAAVAGPLLTTGVADAAGFEVTNLDESGAGSLRQAILDANALAGADVITFQSGLTGTITLSSGQLSITDSVTITGPGAANLTIDADRTSRIFYLYNNASLLDVTISGLTLTGGQSPTGGAIQNLDENLTLDSMVLDNNVASGDGNGDGGALWADGFNMTVTIRDSVMSGNTAQRNGGAIYVEDTGGPFTIERTVIRDNSAVDDGGGIYFYDPDESVSITDSTISGNDADGDGGGIFLYDTDGGPFTIERTTISGNTASSGGGMFLYGPNDTVNVVNSTITGNSALTNSGGGVYLYNGGGLLSFEHSTIAGNVAAAVGGNFFINSGYLTLDHAVVADGSAASYADISTSQDIDANWSLIEDSNGVPLSVTSADNIVDTDPALGALANNGGLTQTQLPGVGSQLIDAGDPAFAAPPAT